MWIIFRKLVYDVRYSKRHVCKIYLIKTYFKGCGGYFDTSNGSIQYPESNTTLTYQSNMNCAWMIEVNPSRVVEISFVWIDIENSLTCSFDYVKVNYFDFYI